MATKQALKALTNYNYFLPHKVPVNGHPFPYTGIKNMQETADCLTCSSSQNQVRSQHNAVPLSVVWQLSQPRTLHCQRCRLPREEESKYVSQQATIQWPVEHGAMGCGSWHRKSNWRREHKIQVFNGKIICYGQGLEWQFGGDYAILSTVDSIY